MSIETGVGEKTEKAIAEKKDKPDLTPVFEDWKNNASGAENTAERKTINDAVHKRLPNITIIDFGIGETADQPKLVETYNAENHSIEIRKVEDFSIVKSDDLSKPMQDRKLTDDQVVQLYSEKVDKDKDKSKAKGESDSGNTDKSPEVSKDPAITDVKQYTIQPGDNLWKIARREIGEANKANGKPESMPSPLEVKAFIDKIVFANQNGDGAIKNANLIYTGKTLNIPIEKSAKKEEIAPEKKDEKEPVKQDPETETPENKTKENQEPDNKEKSPSDNEENVDVKPSSANSDPSGRFIAKPNTYENPTIGAEEAAREAAVLTKYFDQMRTLDANQSGNDYVTKEEINKFIAASKANSSKDTEQTVPNADEIKVLERAAEHTYRIACTSDDQTFSESAITKKDIESFSAQEKDFEGQYQARFYLDKHFDKLAHGKNSVFVSEIKTYRDSLKSDANSASELAAVDNLLDQLAKARFGDSSALIKSQVRAQIRDNVAGYSYQEYGGRSYPLPPLSTQSVATK